MFSTLDLRALADLSATERSFLSVYLSGPAAARNLDKKLARRRRALADAGDARNEREHFDQNVEMINDYLARNPLKSGALCLFACWALDHFQAVPVAAPLPDLVCVDSSPYIRPLAELRDEYENVAVVVADNKRARIYLVSSAVAGDPETVRGNVKNHVRKGGWSQQRYERRRDKQLLHYAREIADALARLDREEDFRRVLLVGGKEILRIVCENLPAALAKKVIGRKAVDLGRPQDAMERDIWEMFFAEERRSEQRRWERIRSAYLSGGPGRVGLDDVLDAAKHGRVDTVIVERDFEQQGIRCRDCDHLHARTEVSCSNCGSSSVYEVEVINELCELLLKSGAEVDFTDPIPTLREVGRIAALLRY